MLIRLLTVKLTDMNLSGVWVSLVYPNSLFGVMSLPTVWAEAESGDRWMGVRFPARMSQATICPEYVPPRMRFGWNLAKHAARTGDWGLSGVSGNSWIQVQVFRCTLLFVSDHRRENVHRYQLLDWMIDLKIAQINARADADFIEILLPRVAESSQKCWSKLRQKPFSTNRWLITICSRHAAELKTPPPVLFNSSQAKKGFRSRKGVYQTWHWKIYSGELFVNFLFHTRTTPSGSFGASSLLS